MGPLRVVLADDHVVVRAGLRALLERDGLQVVAEAGTGEDALRLSQEHEPDVAVLDLSMPGMNGLDAGREILRSTPRTGVVLLTMHIEDYQVAAALRAGIRGYVSKTQCPEVLSQAIAVVARGGTYLTPNVAQVVVGAYLAGTLVPADPLSPRERQVLRMIAEGKTTKEVASALELSVKTVESYRSSLMAKLDIHQTAGLVRYAIRHGVIQA
jgi:two-component system, NarL family, response regulator NreC